MAFKEVKIEDSETAKKLPGILLNVDNGDLEALESIKDKWKFKDKESVLRYALAVMSQATDPILYIEKEGIKTGLSPNPNLMLEDNDGIEGVNGEEKLSE